MDGRRTVLLNGIAVLGSRISFIAGKAVFRPLIAVFNHDPVSGDLRQNTRRSDQETPGIALDDRTLREIALDRAITIDKDSLRRPAGLFGNRIDRTNHRAP